MGVPSNAGELFSKEHLLKLLAYCIEQFGGTLTIDGAEIEAIDRSDRTLYIDRAVDPYMVILRVEQPESSPARRIAPQSLWSGRSSVPPRYAGKNMSFTPIVEPAQPGEPESNHP